MYFLHKIKGKIFARMLCLLFLLSWQKKKKKCMPLGKYNTLRNYYYCGLGSEVISVIDYRPKGHGFDTRHNTWSNAIC